MKIITPSLVPMVSVFVTYGFRHPTTSNPADPSGVIRKPGKPSNPGAGVGASSPEKPLSVRTRRSVFDRYSQEGGGEG
ncbi:hypothetical protein MHYP_G00218100 [Metynnis hypsauchen]